MKPNQFASRKLNLNKQTIQKLDNQKLSEVKGGAAGTTTVLLSITVVEATTIGCTIVCGITIG